MVLLACTAGMSTPARANSDTEFQVWNAFIAQFKLAPDSSWGGWLDVHARRRAGSTLLIARPAIGWHPTSNLVLHLGYAYIPAFRDNAADPAAEQRIWQQVIWNHKLSSVLKLSGRLRLEQRFGDGDDVGHRVRAFLRGQWNPSATSPIFFAVWDELFWQLNDTDWGAESGFDQNRLFVGLGVPTGLTGLRAEVGYMYVYVNRSALDHHDHVLAINLFYSR